MDCLITDQAGLKCLDVHVPTGYHRGPRADNGIELGLLTRGTTDRSPGVQEEQVNVDNDEMGGNDHVE
jgi:hypothetical protein